MFEEQNKNNGVEDILAATEGASAPEAPLGPPTALAQGKLQPVQPGASKLAVPAEQLSSTSAKSFPLKKILAFVIVFLVVGGSAAAGYFWWQGRSQALVPAVVPLGQPNNEPAATSPAAGSEAPNTPNNELNQALDQFQQNAIDQTLNPLAPPADNNQVVTPATGAAPAVDTDQDGLNDVDELTQGTNPSLVDTDGDGLSDWEEVSVFGTNPLNPDTDGDTYTDGSEVQNGYNPNGAGKLLDFEKSKTQAQ